MGTSEMAHKAMATPTRMANVRNKLVNGRGTLVSAAAPAPETAIEARPPSSSSIAHQGSMRTPFQEAATTTAVVQPMRSQRARRKAKVGSGVWPGISPVSQRRKLFCPASRRRRASASTPALSKAPCSHRGCSCALREGLQESTVDTALPKWPIVRAIPATMLAVATRALIVVA
eukprot:225008-Prymnesium_polylepis.1